MSTWQVLPFLLFTYLVVELVILPCVGILCFKVRKQEGKREGKKIKIVGNAKLFDKEGGILNISGT